MPKVVAGLTQYVAEKKHGDCDHPAFTPNLIATHGTVNIKGHTSVFGFFAGMPHPQGLQPFWRLRQKVRVVEQPCCENRGVVFVGSSDGHRMNGFLLVDVGNAAKGAFFSSKRCAVVGGPKLACSSGLNSLTPRRNESMKNCSPTGKLMDKAFMKAEVKASPPFQRNSNGVSRSIRSLRTVKSDMVMLDLKRAVGRGQSRGLLNFYRNDVHLSWHKA